MPRTRFCGSTRPFLVALISVLLLVGQSVLVAPLVVAEAEDPEGWDELMEIASTLCLNPQIRDVLRTVNDTLPADLLRCEGENNEEFEPGDDLGPVVDLAKQALRLGGGECAGPGPEVCGVNASSTQGLTLESSLPGEWTVLPPSLDHDPFTVTTDAGHDPLEDYQDPDNGTWLLVFVPTQEGDVPELDYTLRATIGDEVWEIHPPVAAGAGNLDIWQMSPAVWVFNAHTRQTVACAPALPDVCPEAEPQALQGARFFMDDE